MKTFKTFLKEYLTDDQRERYAATKMSRKARMDTDHFFGKRNDTIYGDLSTDEHLNDKSEIHKHVERHIGNIISHDDYRRGMIKDKYGRDVKIGRLIKDEQLRNNYASDQAREGAKLGSKFTTRTVRGTEVAGQTNSAPDPQHPKGHSWNNISCKNVDTGINRQFLKKEIKHGTVVHFVHDHNGQEIYRATLHPFHSETGDVIYNVDAEYGVKHPSFTRSAHDIAAKLSSPKKTNVLSMYKKHPEVYDDSGVTNSLHPKSTTDDVNNAMTHSDPHIRSAAASNINIDQATLDKALRDEAYMVQKAAASNPRVTDSQLKSVLDDPKSFVTLKNHILTRSPGITTQLLHHVVNGENPYLARTALEHSMSTPDMFETAFDKHPKIHTALAAHPRVPDHIMSKLIKHPDRDVRMAAVMNTHATKKHHLETASYDDDQAVRNHAIYKLKNHDLSS